MNEQATLRDTAERALATMRNQEFDHVQVSATRSHTDELNINHNEPSLLRSAECSQLTLLGIVDGRIASTELADLSPHHVRERARSLYADASSAPQDAANAVSSAERRSLVQGPQQSDLDLLASKAEELLAFRARETPKMMIDEANAKHTLQRSHTLTSGGSDLACSVGCYSMSAFGTAREGQRSSSFNYTGGSTDDLARGHAADLFGLGDMLRDTEQQIHTQPLPGKFIGEVVLTPNAVSSLLDWLHGQLGDTQLIAGSSRYRDSVGQPIASTLLNLRSRFDAPGVAAVSSDGFVTPPVEIVRDGRLLTLLPSLYGSRKTGLPHVPVAKAGWEIAPGETARAELLVGVARGAVVGRLSMGNPAANGDFSGVIKNSFAIVDGVVGTALSEVMIAGNMARMLKDIIAISRERIDTGALRLPWIRIANLHFS